METQLLSSKLGDEEDFLFALDIKNSEIWWMKYIPNSIFWETVIINICKKQSEELSPPIIQNTHTPHAPATSFLLYAKWGHI